MRPQSMLFTIYGEYVRHYGSEIWVGSLTGLMGEFGLTEQAVRAAISRMLRQGWLESRKSGEPQLLFHVPARQAALERGGGPHL